MMPEFAKPESLLVADIGSVTTKVGLVDYVAGDFRFVAAGSAFTTTDITPDGVIVGVRSAVRQVESLSERKLLTDDGQLLSPERPGGQGIDSFIVITSAPTPLRVAIVGLSREVSVASAMRAAEATHATIVATLALDESGGRWLPVKNQSEQTLGKKAPTVTLQDPSVIAAETLAAAKPEVIILVGGIDGGATSALYDIANLITAIIAARDEDARPTVIFAGNCDARPQIANRIGQLTELRVVDNVRPTIERENLVALQRELATLYAEKKITWLPGLSALTNWTPNSVITTARAFENVVRFLSRRHKLNVLGADIGAASTTIVTARQDTSHTRVVRAGFGIGSGLENVIDRVGLAGLTNWLPLEMESDQAHVRWLNHALRPWSVPTTREEVQLMQSAARATLSNALEGTDTSDLNLILLTGGMFAYNTNLGALALVALDALQPHGIFTLAVDAFGLASAFGGLASVNAGAAASVIERDGFVTLGTVIAPLSSHREGQIDLRVRIQPSGGGAMELEVQHGSLELIPLPVGQKASIEIKTARGVDLGRKNGVFKANIEGGALGLVIDARGRPIVLPHDLETRRSKIHQWYWDVGGEVTIG